MAKNINRHFITAIAAVLFLIAGTGAGASVAASDVPSVQFDVQTNCKIGIVVSVSLHGNPTVSDLGARWHNLSQSLNGYSGLEVGHTPIAVDVRVDNVTLYATINGVSKSAEVDLFGPCGEASASVVIYGDVVAPQPWRVTSVSFDCSGVVDATLSSGSGTGGIIFFVYQNGDEIAVIGQRGVIGQTEYSQAFDTSGWVSGAEMQAAVLLPGTIQPRVYSSPEVCDAESPGNGGDDGADPGTDPGDGGTPSEGNGDGNGTDSVDDSGTDDADNGNGDNTGAIGNQITVQVLLEGNVSVEGSEFGVYAPEASTLPTGAFYTGIVGADNVISIPDVTPGTYNIAIAPENGDLIRFSIVVETDKTSLIVDLRTAEQGGEAVSPGVNSGSDDSAAASDSDVGRDADSVSGLPSTGIGTPDTNSPMLKALMAAAIALIAVPARFAWSNRQNRG